MRGVRFIAASLPLLFVAAALSSTTSSAAPDAPTKDGGADGATKDGGTDAAKPTPPPLPPGDAKPDVPGDAPKKPDALPPPLDAAKPIPPDPVPLAADAIYVLSVRWNKGTLTLDKVRHEKLAKTAAVPRHFGRFAAELYVGPTLLERIRFDFPLIHDDTNMASTFAKGLDVTVEVKVPDSDRPTKLEIWDRATDKRWSFPYPPK